MDQHIYSISFPVFSIRLILAQPNDSISEIHAHRLMDQVFQAMVLIVGLDELLTPRNVDRTKRDLRVRTKKVRSITDPPGPSRIGGRYSHTWCPYICLRPSERPS